MKFIGGSKSYMIPPLVHAKIMLLPLPADMSRSGFTPTTVPDNNRQSGPSPVTVPEMSTGLDHIPSSGNGLGDEYDA